MKGVQALSHTLILRGDAVMKPVSIEDFAKETADFIHELIAKAYLRKQKIELEANTRDNRRSNPK